MKRYQKTIGIFALQGSFIEHQKKIKELGVEVFLIRDLSDVTDRKIDGVILPGGESTTMMKLLKETGLDKWLVGAAKKGTPIFGTCAGMIVLSKSYLNLIDVDVARNAYGPQLESFEDEIECNLKSIIYNLKSIFIRAPKISKIGQSVKILAHHKQTPVLVQQKNIMAASFHPELTSNTTVHEFFVNFQF